MTHPEAAIHTQQHTWKSHRSACDPEIQKEVSKLFGQTLSIYFDLDKSPHTALKALTECFYD